MVNYQGEMSYSNCNANSQNKANHQSTGTLQLFPAASSLSAGDQRFSAQVLGSNHVGLGIGSSAGVAPQNVDAGAEYAANNCYNNLNVSLTLGLHSYGPGNQNNSNSRTTVTGHGRSSSAGQEQGLDSSPVFMRHLSCKRKSSEHTTRELLVGESSSTAAQTGISKRRASEVYGSNGINISTSRTSPVVHQQQSETIIGHGNIRSDVQHLNGAILYENFGSNTHHHIAANQQDLLPTSNFSSGHMRNTHIQLPGQSPLYGQDNHPPFFRSAESFISPISSVQPDEHAPNFHETSQAPAWIDMMRSSSGYSSFLPFYTAVESAAVAPFYDSRNINENGMLNHLVGRSNWAHDARNSHFMSGAASFSGGFICPFHGFDHSIIPPANAPAWFPGFSFADRYTLTLARIANGHVLATTGLPQHGHNPSESDHSAALREMGFPFRSGNAASPNQHTSRAGSEAQAAANLTWLLAHSQHGLGLWPENSHTSEARFEDLDDDGIYDYFWSSANTQNRRRLSLELHYRLELLHSAEPWRPMHIPAELRLLDNSVIVDILTGYGTNADEVDVEDQADPDGGPESGLSEEMILSHLNLEKFQAIPDGSEENECCCICQDDYEENEDLGKFWCGHRFHVDCIKSWLVLKNICPMCKQIAIPAFDDSP